MAFAGIRDIIICIISTTPMVRNGPTCTGGTQPARTWSTGHIFPLFWSHRRRCWNRQIYEKGEHFSGSAVVLDDETVFYLTRHLGPMEDGEETVQQQWMTRSRDMLEFEPEKLVIGEHPVGASFDFRDPKVLKVGDVWYMVLASAVDGKAAILLYRSEDMEHWDYVKPLVTEPEEGVRCFECPDFFPLDGSFTAWGALMCHRDVYGRYQMSRYYIGEFRDENFTVKSTGWFDFGSNCYAMQSFEHEGRRIAIGWISDFYGEHVEVENGAYWEHDHSKSAACKE